MKKYIIALIVIVLVGGAVVWAKFGEFVTDVPNQDEPVACTMEAKQCPDGSYVGRSGPKCEFAECPAVSAVKDCPQLSPIGPNFCPNGKIESGGVNANGCPLPPRCVI